MTNWKIINGYPNYAINEQGDVKSLRYDRMLKPSANDNTYLYVNLIHNKRKKTTAIHRLVIEHFGETAPCPSSIVDHKDQDKQNNHINNLEWVSVSENTVRAYGNQDKKVHVKELREAGLTITQIAKAINMSTSFVGQAIHDQ